MFENEKKYYLETNALYSLCNHFEDIKNSSMEIATSLYALEEIVCGIGEENYNKRKIVLSKLRMQKIKIYPYLPIECISLAFGLDISEFPAVLSQKLTLNRKVHIICSANSYEEYCKSAEKEGIDVVSIKKDDDAREKRNKDFLCEVINEDRKNIKKLRREQSEKKTYVEMDVSKAFGIDNDISNQNIEENKQIIKSIMEELRISYEEQDVLDLIENRDKDALVAFLLGKELYGAAKALEINKKQADRNDIYDLMHLLYLRNENYVVVSDDKIYEFVTMQPMRITAKEFLKLIV